MAEKRMVTVDGNEAASSVAHRVSEVVAIYPITPSSTMGEFADEWSARGQRNIWGAIPLVQEMQSEGGAAGAVHGAIQAGALSTTFTASQGLLLMIPNMYKIAGELTPFVMHVSARTVATHALSIFGDHSDVMACRQTGFGMLCSNTVQEAHDFAAIAHGATLKARVPLLHFFDGWRTSSEVAKICFLDDGVLRKMIDEDLVEAHRQRALSPDRPVLRGSAQNPDTFFQQREACNPFFDACPRIVQEYMDRFAKITGRAYKIFEYEGHPQAEKVIVLMGSGAETVHEYVEWANAKGHRVGLLKVRLFRPFSVQAFAAAMPRGVKGIAVLDRTKEPGSAGEPLYQDVLTAITEARAENAGSFAADLKIIGGRYGLSSKEFTPAMVKAVYDELDKPRPKNHFTVGIRDDVSHTSLAWEENFDIEPDNVVRAMFFGLGADGTVGANKNSIKIIGEETDNYAQGYFVYDSKKSGAITISHLRFGPKPIHSEYLIRKANFIGCHQFNFIEKYDVLEAAAPGAVFLLNSPYGADKTWDHLPAELQQQIIDRKLKFYVIDAYDVAGKTGMGQRINTIMQTCFFAISGVLPREEAIAQIKKSIQKTYGRKGEEIVRRNFQAVDDTLANLHEVRVPARVTATAKRPPTVSPEAPELVRKVEAVMMANKGDTLPVSAFPVDGTWPTGTTKWEKRNIALELPVWDPAVCIQCNKCSMVCPHATIRPKVYDPALLAKAPPGFRAADYKAPDFKGQKFTIQVAPEDCTGCGLCVMACPAKDKANPKHKAVNLEPKLPILEREKANWAFFETLPVVDRAKIARVDVKGSQFFEPLFEYSGACGGCGETPYLKLLSQLFGDRAMIANATGCSSIYGGNLPTTPYAKNKDGRGPTWSNSLFEDCAEFGFGFRLAVDKHREQAIEMLRSMGSVVGDDLVKGLIEADQSNEAGIAAQRQRVAALKSKLGGVKDPKAARLLQRADYLVKKSIWLVGGDGWAYDIGFGGLDHVLAMNRDVNILVLDTEVYSNTGGQQSKATPLGAAAKFAAAGKAIPKKDLGMIAMTYGHCYVASVALGARDAQTVQAFLEADSYAGTSIIIAYSHCIAHGYDLQFGLEQQKLAVDSGMWPLYRYDPRRATAGEPPLKLDSPAPKIPVAQYMQNETRFRMVEKVDPKRFHDLAEMAQAEASKRIAFYQQLAAVSVARVAGGGNGKDQARAGGEG